MATTTTREARTVITNLGREMMARFNARAHDWVPAGYRLYFQMKWGEGGWEDDGSGLKVPKNPFDFVANTDLEIVLNPGSYPGSSYATALIELDLANELAYDGGVKEFFRCTPTLDMNEENDDTSSSDVNPDFWEVAVFDNAGDMVDSVVRDETGRTDNNMILYSTFSSVTKVSTRKFQVNMRLPFKVT